MSSPPTQPDDSVIREIMQDKDLYSILGLAPIRGQIDKNTLRRAYLAKSRLCHPDKFPHNHDATQAFQKVAVAYDTLSNPLLKRRYDEHRASASSTNSAASSSSSAEFDVFARARSTGYAEDTLRSVVIGVFNDFLDNGDLEVIKNLLRAVNQINPGSPLTIGEEGIRSVLSTLHSIRERALTCRTCIYALHAELDRLLAVQTEFSGLGYFDIMGRTKYAVKLSRIAVGLPVVLEKALIGAERERRLERERARQKGAEWVDGDGRARRKEGEQGTEEGEGVFPKNVMLVARAVDVALERMERMLK
ncbi:hypothetical protein NMY22_g7443 [Coprinellus aureogranulatus]|nr:hypothetical protein NMY22_g7443 [Coprinellus aureogranulatus]